MLKKNFIKLQYLLSALISVCCILIIHINPPMLQEHNLLDLLGNYSNSLRSSFGYLIIITILGFGIMLFICKEGIYFSRLLCLVSILFGIIQTLALNLYYFETCDNLFTPRIILYNLLLVASYGYIFYLIGSLFFYVTKRLVECSFVHRLENHTFIISFLLILLAWKG